MGTIFFKNKKEKLLKSPKTFFELSAKDIDGQEISFSTYQKYKAIIVVNVASSCGLTKSNYKELNELYDKYQYIILF
jgi:glutathione peroxidase-family protein